MFENIRAAVMGSINMDMILQMQTVPEVGENLLGTQYSYACGGKGANQATGLARLGAKTKMIGKVADDANGQKLLQNLRENKVDVSGIGTDGAQTGLAVILLDGNGKNRIVVYEGANAEIDPVQAASQLTDDTDVLLVQFETKEDAVVECVNRAIETGIITVVDCGPAKDFALERMRGVTILSPNESETKALTGIFPEDEESILAACGVLMQRSKAKYVVLKLGERGCAVWDGTQLKILPAYPAETVDTTAAGDCFTAAMALEYVRSGDILRACDLGNKAGCIAVSRMGAAASMPTAEELAAFGK